MNLKIGKHVIGDERREKIDFKHKQLFISGYTKHDKVLEYLKKLAYQLSVQGGGAIWKN